MTKTNASASAVSLRRTLQQQLLLGKRLVELAEIQSETIIEGDVSRLAALELEQRLLLDQQETLETTRLKVTRELAWALGMERVPNLAGLLPLLPTADRDALSQLRVQILETQSRLDTLNARNAHLLQNALEYVRFSLDLLTTATLKPAAYGTNINQLTAPAFYVDSKA